MPLYNRPAIYKKNDKKSWKIYARETSIIVVIVLLSLLNVIGFAFSGILGSIDYITERDKATPEQIASAVIADDEEEFPPEEGSDFSAEAMAEADRKLAEIQVDSEDCLYEEGVMNVLLLGTDGRMPDTERARADAIIILSINENTKKIIMTSIMRDSYVSIPGRDKNDKINAAHAYGGAQLSKETVEKTFGIKLDGFADVNFYAFIDIVDALGGVTIAEVSKAEKIQINKTVKFMNTRKGRYSSLLDHSGKDLKLTGTQALGYARIRNVGNGDYERTERQRRVLNEIIKNIKQSDHETIMAAIEAAASNLSTDFTEAELIDMATRVPEYIDYEVVSQRIPYEGTFEKGTHNGAWIVQMDFEKNRDLLYRSVFEDAYDRFRGNGTSASDAVPQNDAG